MSDFLSIFPTTKPLIGMVHFKGETSTEILDRALLEISQYTEAGLDSIMVETYFNNATHVREALAYLSKNDPGVPYGVNILNVDLVGFLFAREFGASYVQVDSVVGHVKPRDEASLTEFFNYCRSEFQVPLMGGVRFKYQPVLSENSLATDLEIAKSRCDAVCVTADATGQQTSMGKIEEFREGLGDFPLIVCSGVRADNIARQLSVADGAVVGSYAKDTGFDSGDVDPARVRELIAAAEGQRKPRV